MKASVVSNPFINLYREFETWTKDSDELKNEEILKKFLNEVKNLDNYDVYSEMLELMKTSLKICKNQ